MKENDAVYFTRPGGRAVEAVFLRHVSMTPPTCEVARGETRTKWLVRPEELELKSVVDEREAAERLASARDRLEPIAAAWRAGRRTVAEIASALGVKQIQVLSRFKEAQRRGMLHE